MSTYINTKCIQFQCSCGAMVSLYSLYLCRYCMANRCSNCVYHEIDPRYCPNCQETMPSKEANDKLARCSNCYNCPICGCTLITRAITASSSTSPTQAVKETSQSIRLYYLACAFCKWTTKRAGIPDRLQINDRWDVLEQKNKQRLVSLLLHYKKIAAHEKLDRERRKYLLSRKKYHSSTETFNVTSSLMKRGKVPRFVSSSEENEISKILPSESVCALPDLDEKFLQLEDSSNVSTLSQRFAAPESQLEWVSELLPVRKQIVTRLSKRCKQCQHSLVKGEQLSGSISFKMHRMAMYYLPDLRVWFHPEISVNKTCEIVFTMCNNTDYPITVSFQPFSHPKSNAKVILPDDTIVLLPSPEYSSYGSAKSVLNVEESNRAWFVKRTANKLALRLHIILLESSNVVYFSFAFKHNCAVMQEVPQSPMISTDEATMNDLIQNVLVTLNSDAIAAPNGLGLQETCHEVTVSSCGWPD